MTDKPEIDVADELASGRMRLEIGDGYIAIVPNDALGDAIRHHGMPIVQTSASEQDRKERKIKVDLYFGHRGGKQ